VLVVRVLRTWRDVRRTGRVLAAGVAEIAARLSATAAGFSQLGEHPLRAAHAARQLEQSLGELAVLRRELQRIRRSVPSK
jgi:hypothetical protein